MKRTTIDKVLRVCGLLFLLIQRSGAGYRSIDALISDYKLHHHNTTIGVDNVCNNQYIVGRYHCPTQIGTRIFEFLNAFAVSIITNRTLVWSYCEGGHCAFSPIEDCEELLHRRAWIPSLELVRQRIRQAQCSNQFGKSQGKRTWLDWLTYGSNPVGLSDYALEPDDQMALLSCSAIDSTSARILDIGINEGHQSFYMSLPNSMLSDESRNRAQTLFSMGAQYAYGLLFKEAFKFSDAIKQMNDELFKQIAPRSVVTSSVQDNRTISKPLEPLTVAMHIRHFDRTDTGDIDVGESKCLNALFSRISSTQLREDYEELSGNDTSEDTGGAMFRDCVVLIASDRPMAISRNAEHTRNNFGCRIIHRPAPEADIIHEHGPSANSVFSVADVELLSRAHVFIGTSRSVYSILMASLVSALPLNVYLRQKERKLEKGSLLVSFAGGQYRKRRRLSPQRNISLNLGDSLWLPHCAHSDIIDVEMKARPTYFHKVLKKKSWDCAAARSLVQESLAGQARQVHFDLFRAALIIILVAIPVMCIALYWCCRRHQKQRRKSRDASIIAEESL